MNFDDSPEEAAYRAGARAWIAANAADFVATRLGAPKPDEQAFFDEAKRWQALKATAGYSVIPLAEEWGGGGGTQMQRHIFAQEEAAAGINFGHAMTVAAGTAIPTIMKFGTERQKQEFIRPTVAGRFIWAQVFSEPSAGSDVAGVRTRAVPDGDGWRISGQKVWVSHAHFADYGLVLVRTDPTVVKHKGLTMFIIDMRDPAITIRPIHQIDGGYEFTEVFLNDLYVQDSNRLGAVNDGWSVVLEVLMNERFTVGVLIGPSHDDLLEYARQMRGTNGNALADKALRSKLAQWYIEFEGQKFMRYRTMTALSRGQTPGPENSIGKLVIARATQDLAVYAMDIAGQYGMITDPAYGPDKGSYANYSFVAGGIRIAGGAEEVLRNIIAERVLGMPADYRPDKAMPFNEVRIGR